MNGMIDAHSPMLRKTLIAAGCVLLVLGAMAVGAWWHYKPILRVEEGVRARLIDPGSARFERVEFNRTTRAGCGLVDAKDGTGHYAGYTPFVLDPYGNLDFLQSRRDGESAQQVADRQAEDAVYRKEAQQYCAVHG